MKNIIRKANLSSGLRLMFVLLTVLVTIGTAEAANYTVTTTNESGAGSLRDAIGQANANPGADSIGFAAGLTGTITLASTLPQITQDLTITGPGAGVVTVSGNHLHQVFNISPSVTVSISGLTISNGLGPPDGGGISNAGTLAITHSTFSGNSGRAGGGIYNAGTLTITNSTFHSNPVTAVGGGVLNSNGAMLTITNSTFYGNSASASGGGILNSGTMTVTNSTISGNAAGRFGGGIFNNAGTMMITNSTLSGNTAPELGGGIYNSGTATFKNSIIANSPAGGNCAGAAVIAAGINFSTDDTCLGFNQVTPGQLNLGPLLDNGGPTQTHALPEGSVAIDAVTDCTDIAGNPLTTDQRGNNRPQDGDADGIESCDVGAFEAPMPVRVECSRGNPPTVSCPGDITVAPTSLSGAVVTYTAPVCLDCDCDHQTPIQIAGLASGSTFPVGTTVNTYLVTDGGQTGTCSFSVTVAPSKCPLPQGYWKNNPGAWPVTSLSLGSATYSQAELLAILNTPIGTGKNADASLILADQLIAAKLNVAHGSDPAPISAAITAADALLAPFSNKLPYRVKPSSAVGQQMIALGTLLEQYNKGLLTGCTP
jgi:hypothetical protein